MTLQRFLEHFENPRKVGKNYTARCPAHDDTSRNTLHIALGDDGRRLVICRTRICDINAILGKAGLRASDLFDDVDGARPWRPPGGRRRPRAPLPDDDATWTAVQLAAAQRSALVDVVITARRRRPEQAMIRLADPIKRGWRIVQSTRQCAAAQCPFDPNTIELLAYAATLERYVRHLEAEQDTLAMELRRQ